MTETNDPLTFETSDGHPFHVTPEMFHEWQIDFPLVNVRAYLPEVNQCLNEDHPYLLGRTKRPALRAAEVVIRGLLDERQVAIEDLEPVAQNVNNDDVFVHNQCMTADRIEARLLTGVHGCAPAPARAPRVRPLVRERVDVSALPLTIDSEQCAALVGICRATWWKLHSSGRTPAPLRLSGRVVRWRRDEVFAWVSAGCPNRDKWKFESK